jgi:hypothetical protein
MLWHYSCLLILSPAIYPLTIKPVVMKNTRLVIIALFVALFAICSFLKPPVGSVKGTVNPPDGATRATVISATDSFKSLINAEGVFVITDIKPGNYNLIIEAKAPYKNATREDILVTEGGTADVGEIKLSK